MTSGAFTGLASVEAGNLTGDTIAANVTKSSLVQVGTVTTGTWSGNFGAVSGANLTSLTAANIAAGTAGISISGNAATVTTNANLSGDVTSSGNTATLGSNFKIGSVGALFDGSGGVIAANSVVYVRCPFAGSIAAWSILVDTGTCTIKCWKIAAGSAIPTVANVINTSGIAISSGTAVRSTTLSDFTTTTVTANDIFAFVVTTIASATKITVQLEVTKT